MLTILLRSPAGEYHTIRMMPLATRLFPYSIALLSLFTTNSCSTLSYYQQTISGHLAMMRASRPVTDILNTDQISDELRSKLQLAVDIKVYATDVLLLPDNGSYESYADLGRRFVIWNVVAAPEFSLEPIEWCYLIVGCLSYRGYFSESEAQRFAQALTNDGYDVHVAGVIAYSTLGWFADPVTSPMLHSDAANLARVIFHELAHQLIYFAGDTEYNEAFADALAGYGVRRWLQDKNRLEELAQFEQSLAGEREFTQLVLRYKQALEDLYRTTRDVDALRERKQGLFATLRTEHLQSRTIRTGRDEYQAWFASGLNNAKIALVSTYKNLVPGFEQLLARNRYDLKQFYRAVAALADCDEPERRRFLASNDHSSNCKPSE